jgi:hypothetical protein
MSPKSPLYIIPVLSSSDLKRDLIWYEKQTGFNYAFGDEGYTGLQRDEMEIHLQFHHDNEEDPVHGSVIKMYVKDLQPYIDEFVERGTITKGKPHMNTPWGTHEFGFYDLNKNAIYIVQDV